MRRGQGQLDSCKSACLELLVWKMIGVGVNVIIEGMGRTNVWAAWSSDHLLALREASD
jgi:hypothetical protein